jgi:hypothetical protein
MASTKPKESKTTNLINSNKKTKRGGMGAASFCCSARFAPTVLPQAAIHLPHSSRWELRGGKGENIRTKIQQSLMKRDKNI